MGDSSVGLGHLEASPLLEHAQQVTGHSTSIALYFVGMGLPGILKTRKRKETFASTPACMVSLLAGEMCINCQTPSPE